MALILSADRMQAHCKLKLYISVHGSPPALVFTLLFTIS